MVLLKIGAKAKKLLFFLLFKKCLIAPGWYLKIKWLCFFSRKVRVGFGPITTGEDDLAERKWRIDPIIDGINRRGGKYVAGFFIHPTEMRKFDILIIVKKINPEFVAVIERLKGKRFIYDIVDNPNDQEKYRFYFRTLPGFIEQMDGFILSSPVHRSWTRWLDKPALLIEHPILNSVYKRTYRSESEIRILAQGYFENLQNLRWLEPLLPDLSLKVGKPVRLIYHSEEKKVGSEFVQYIQWNVKDCFEIMQWADIAITMKDLFKLHQYTKPSTKVIAYMAAGLPVICKPTAADRLVIEDKITGFFAYRPEDWMHWIQRLASHEPLRRQVGRAARKSVMQSYSLNHILEKYISILDSTWLKEG